MKEKSDLPKDVQETIDAVTSAIDTRVNRLCRELGYGAVAQSAAKLEAEWRKSEAFPDPLVKP